MDLLLYISHQIFEGESLCNLCFMYSAIRTKASPERCSHSQSVA